MGGDGGPRDASKVENFDAWARVKSMDLLARMSAAQINRCFFCVDF
jgi:hypothetical protein